MCIRDRNEAVITKADKGNTLVIMYNSDYIKKDYEFITCNNIKRLKNDPTTKYTKRLNSVINECTTLFDKDTRRQIKQMKPRAPIFLSLIHI